MSRRTSGGSSTYGIRAATLGLVSLMMGAGCLVSPRVLAQDEPQVTVRTLPTRKPASGKPATNPAPVRTKVAGERSTYRGSQSAGSTRRRPTTRIAAAPHRKTRSTWRTADSNTPRRSTTARRAARTDTPEPRMTQRSEETRSQTGERRRYAYSGTRRRRTSVSTSSSSPGRGGSASTLNNEGLRLIRRGRYAEAEGVLRRALTMRPSGLTYPYALYNLGWSLLGQGKAQEAIEPLAKTAGLQPSRWEPQQRLAEAYDRLGRKDRAQAAYARARALRGGRGRSTSSGERGYRRQGAGDPGAVRMMVTDAAYVATYSRREALFQELKAKEADRASGN